ncbi:transglycosylase family protein [Actinomadura chibensis]|uniref:DUF348 domain-containing protein n=1 Tax=Actinomadura chibensis TaxID=392828 RepID=A0A5D0NQV7_9ACTN|nr:transglycosylase family protein [Actinomadura chibensis]TYB46471.1 DUF348 domain-containing protein [Actinomadura chibensis]
MPRHHARRSSAPSAVLLVAALLAAGCGGGGGSTGPQKAAAADAPRTSAAPRKIVIVVDGRRTEAMTTGTTVRQVLDQARVALGPHDLVKPLADQPPGDVVYVLRLLSAPKLAMVKVPQKTVRKNSSSVPPWSEKVLREGRPGVLIVQWAYVRRKGKKVKKVIAKRVKSRPVTRVLAVGPKSAGSGAAARLNWTALARCESHNNPKAVNPAGYYGLYQFSLASWASVGGKGKPSDAPAAEQTYRAQMLYNKVNGRWQGQWPNCGSNLFS